MTPRLHGWIAAAALLVAGGSASVAHADPLDLEYSWGGYDYDYDYDHDIDYDVDFRYDIDEEMYERIEYSLRREAISRGLSYDYQYEASGIRAISTDYGAVFASSLRRDGSVAFFVSEQRLSARSSVEAGVYRLDYVYGRPAIIHYDPDSGRTRLRVLDDDDGYARFHTPLGDYMCEGVDELLEEFCQSFVACAAYDFCG